MKKIIDYIDYEIGSNTYLDKGIFAIAAYEDAIEGEITDFVISGNSDMIIEALIDAMKEDDSVRLIVTSAANAYHVEVPQMN